MSGNGTTKLIMPKMNLEGVGEVDLTFWYAQPAKAHTHDILNVYYKSSECEQWTLLKQYSMQVSSWRKRTIELPDLSQNYYIAFEAVCRGGYGIVVDDVNVVTEYDAIDTEDYSEIVKIYPNPASNYLNISSLERIDCVCVYDISGRMVEKTDVNDNKTMIDTFRYDRGIYVVCVEIKEKINKINSNYAFKHGDGEYYESVNEYFKAVEKFYAFSTTVPSSQSSFLKMGIRYVENCEDAYLEAEMSK